MRRSWRSLMCGAPLATGVFTTFCARGFPKSTKRGCSGLSRQNNPAVRKRKKGKRPISARVPLQLARTVNKVWGMDFVSDGLAGA